MALALATAIGLIALWPRGGAADHGPSQALAGFALSLLLVVRFPLTTALAALLAAPIPATALPEAHHGHHH